MARTAAEIAALYQGGSILASDLKNHILEYGEAMALAAIAVEREACAKIVDGFSRYLRDVSAQEAREQERLANSIAAQIRNRT